MTDLLIHKITNKDTKNEAGTYSSSSGIGNWHSCWLVAEDSKEIRFVCTSRGSLDIWLTGWPDENAVFQFFPVSNYAGKEIEKQKRCRNPQKIKRTFFCYHNFSQFDSSIILFLTAFALLLPPEKRQQLRAGRWQEHYYKWGSNPVSSSRGNHYKTWVKHTSLQASSKSIKHIFLLFNLFFDKMALKLNILHTYVLYMLCGNLIFILMWFFCF